MGTHRQVQDVVARYVAIMAFYQNDGKTTRTKAAMVAEVRGISAGVGAAKLDREMVQKEILQLVKSKLIARYGSRGGKQLNREFVKVFEGSIAG
jgi:hypothetical protein